MEIVTDVGLILFGFLLGLLGVPLHLWIKERWERPKLIHEIKSALNFELKTNEVILNELSRVKYDPITKVAENYVLSGKINLLEKKIQDALRLYFREVEKIRILKWDTVALKEKTVFIHARDRLITLLMEEENIEAE